MLDMATSASARHSSYMARFYFDVREGSRFVRDPEGEELDNDADAEAEAIELALHIGRDRLPVSEARNVEIDVKNKNGELVLVVRASLEVMRIRNGERME
jgi:hypothetical protein